MTNLLLVIIAGVIGMLAVIGTGWLARWLSCFAVPPSVTRYTGFAFVLGGWAATGINSKQTAPEMAIYAGGLVGLMVVWWWFFRRGTVAATDTSSKSSDTDLSVR